MQAGFSKRDPRYALTRLCYIPPLKCLDYRHHLEQVGQDWATSIDLFPSEARQHNSCKLYSCVLKNIQVFEQLASNFSTMYLKHIMPTTCHSSFINTKDELVIQRVSKVLVSAGEMVFPGDVMYMIRYDALCDHEVPFRHFATDAVFISKVFTSEGALLAHEDYLFDALAVPRQCFCKKYNKYVVPEYEWPIETSWHLLNQIFMANEMSLIKPFQGDKAYKALKAAYFETGKIATYSSFFNNPERDWVTAPLEHAKAISELSCIGAREMKAYFQNNQLEWRKLDGRDFVLCNNGVEASSGNPKFYGIFHKGFRPTYRLVQLDSLFMAMSTQVTLMIYGFFRVQMVKTQHLLFPWDRIEKIFFKTQSLQRHPTDIIVAIPCTLITSPDAVVVIRVNGEAVCPEGNGFFEPNGDFYLITQLKNGSDSRNLP